MLPLCSAPLIALLVAGEDEVCSMLEHGYHELCWDITISLILLMHLYTWWRVEDSALCLVFCSTLAVTPRIQLSIFVTPTLAISGYVIYYFLRGWVFVCCFAFCSCHACHLITTCTLYLHVFIKLASIRSCRIPPLPSLTNPSPTRFSFPSCLTVWPSLHFTQAPRARPKFVPNPNRTFVTVGSGSSPNIYKTSPFSLLDALAYSLSTAQLRSDGSR